MHEVVRSTAYLLPPITYPEGFCMVPHVQAWYARRRCFLISESLGPGLHAGNTEMSGRGLSRVHGCFFASGPLRPPPNIAFEGVPPESPQKQSRHVRRSPFRFFDFLEPELHAGIIEMSGRDLSRVQGCFSLLAPYTPFLPPRNFPKNQSRHAHHSRFHFSESVGPGLQAGSTEMSRRSLSRVPDVFRFWSL